MRQPGMVQSFEQPFTGEKVLPIMGFMRDVVERRIGQKDGAGGLDMDALQSTGKEAANVAIQASQAQAELLARLFAEQVFKPMFRGLLKLAAHPASKERIVRLRGNYIPVNPATWDAGMDVSVNVALGTMNTEKKIGVLMAVVQDQSAILKQFGPDNPVVTLPMLRNAKAKILSLQGVKDVDNYYKPLPMDYQSPPPPEPQPTPDELWIQAEKEMAFQKSMKELAIKQDELRLKEKELDMDAAFRERELAIREADSIRDASTGPHNAEIERYKADLDAENKANALSVEAQVEAEKLVLEREKLAIELRIAELEAQAQVDAVRATPAPPMPEKDTSAADAMKLVAEAVKAMGAQEPPNIVVNAPPAPEVNVEVQQPKKGKRKGKITAPDGKQFTVETDGE